MRKIHLTAAALLLLGTVTLATIGCGRVPGEANDAQVPGEEQTESSGAGTVAADATTTVVPDPVLTATPATLDLTVVATTTEPVYITTADLDNAPTGSSDGRSKIVAHSTLVLIGTVPDAEPRVERIPGRLTNDPSRLDPNWTTIAYVHDVQVERYLKGSGPGTLPIMQPTGHETISPGAAPRFLSHVRYSAHDYYFKRGGRYLLFLRESEHAPGLWVGTAEPYKYQIFEGRARVRTPAKDPGRTFYTRRGESKLLERVQDVIDYQSAFVSSGIPNGVRWNLESLDGKPPLEGTFLTLTVDGNSYSGGGGCSYSGGRTENGLPIAGKDGSFSAMDNFAEPLALCVSRKNPEGVARQAEAYERAILDAQTFEIDGDRLKLLDGSGKVRLIFIRRATLPGQATDLTGTQWRVLDEEGEYGDAPVATLAFLNEHMAGGTTACRDFILDYRVSETRFRPLTFSGKGVLGSTDSCTEEMLELERSFRAHLSSSDDYTVDESSGESVLTVRTTKDELLVLEPLPPVAEDRINGGRWSLVAFTEPDRVSSWHTDYAKITELVSDTALTVSFEESGLLGSGECHSYEASLSIEGSRIEIQDVVVSEKPCDDPDALAEQETRFADVLKRATSFQLYGDRLLVRTEEDEALLFRAE